MQRAIKHKCFFSLEASRVSWPCALFSCKVLENEGSHFRGEVLLSKAGTASVNVDQRHLLFHISDPIRESYNGTVAQSTRFCCKGNNKHTGFQIPQMLSSFPKPPPKCPLCILVIKDAQWASPVLEWALLCAVITVPLADDAYHGASNTWHQSTDSPEKL